MTALDELRDYPNADTLRPALQKLCEKFGQIARLDVLTAVHGSTRQAICFLRLESPEKEYALMKSLGVGRFGGEIVFVVDLNACLPIEGSGSSSRWTECQDLLLPGYQPSELMEKTQCAQRSGCQAQVDLRW